MIDKLAFDPEHEPKLEPIDQQQVTIGGIQHTADTLPAFDFRKTRLSHPAREQLAKIYESVLAGGKAASKRSGLRNLILTNIFNPVTGTYIPVSPHVFLVGKLPTVSKQIGVHRDVLKPLEPFGAAFFTNALVVPDGWGTTGFDRDIAPPPMVRLTNIGFQIVTIEYDCETVDQFEEILSWTRGKDGNGKTKSAAFSEVDQELRKLSDYRGYSIVLSGSRSLHFHFIFSTAHLKNAPYQATAKERQQAYKEHSALLENAYRIYWNHTNDAFDRLLKPSLKADQQLRRATQWRRTPWEIRTLDKPSTILGLGEGTEVPQIVIREDIRTRASKTRDRLLVHEGFSRTNPMPVPTNRSRQGPQTISGDISPLITLLQQECRSEWGEYPKPVLVSPQHNDWVINFKNHPGDRKPSTIVRGLYRRLLINGRHKFGDWKFYLPDHMTANALVDHLALRSGLATVASTKPASQPSNASTNPATSRWLHARVLDEYSNKWPAPGFVDTRLS